MVFYHSTVFSRLTIYTVDPLKLEYAVYAVKAIKLVAHIVQLA